MGGANTKELEDKMWSAGGGNGRKVEKPESSKKSKEKEKLREPTDDDLADEGDADFDSYDPKSAGPIFPDGTINWDCPCLGGAAYGPCGTEFRQAFSCFHFSKEDPKGSDCFPHFREMHNCFTKYPDLYGPKEGEEDEDDDEEDDLFDDEELEVIKETDEAGKSKEKSEEKDKQQNETSPVPKKSAEPTGSPEKKESEKRQREKDVPRKNIPAIL